MTVLVEAAPASLIPYLDELKRLVSLAHEALPGSSLPIDTPDCVSAQRLRQLLSMSPPSCVLELAEQPADFAIRSETAWRYYRHKLDVGRSFGDVRFPVEPDTRDGAIFGNPCAVLRAYISMLYDVEAEHGGMGVYVGESGMGWHTNFTRPGVRVYFTYNRTDTSRFLFYQEGVTPEFASVSEPAGWSVKTFVIPEDRPYFWHAVQAADYRLSLGFRVPVAHPFPIG